MSKFINPHNIFTNICNFNELIGKTVIEFEHCTDCDREYIAFKTNEGLFYLYGTTTPYCSNISIESIVGDLNDLINTPILVSEKATNLGNKSSCEHFTWTFIKFASIKGYVDIRFYGESSGYYSEDAELHFISNSAYQKEAVKLSQRKGK